MIRIILPDRMGGIVYHLRGTVPVSQHLLQQYYSVGYKRGCMVSVVEFEAMRCTYLIKWLEGGTVSAV